MFCLNFTTVYVSISALKIPVWATHVMAIMTMANGQLALTFAYVTPGFFNMLLKQRLEENTAGITL